LGGGVGHSVAVIVAGAERKFKVQSGRRKAGFLPTAAIRFTSEISSLWLASASLRTQSFFWLAAIILVTRKSVWLHGEYRWARPLVWSLRALFAIVTLAYTVARFFKKSGLLRTERKPMS